MAEQIKLILIFVVVIGAAFSIIYLYFSADIFTSILKRPIRFISWGMLLIDLGVMLVTLFSYEAVRGVELKLLGLSVATYFYILYVVGSVLVILGARQFKHTPK